MSFCEAVCRHAPDAAGHREGVYVYMYVCVCVCVCVCCVCVCVCVCEGREGDIEGETQGAEGKRNEKKTRGRDEAGRGGGWGDHIRWRRIGRRESG